MIILVQMVQKMAETWVKISVMGESLGWNKNQKHFEDPTKQHSTMVHLSCPSSRASDDVCYVTSLQVYLTINKYKSNTSMFQSLDPVHTFWNRDEP